MAKITEGYTFSMAIRHITESLGEQKDNGKSSVDLLTRWSMRKPLFSSHRIQFSLLLESRKTSLVSGNRNKEDDCINNCIYKILSHKRPDTKSCVSHSIPTTAETNVPPIVEKKKTFKDHLFETYACCTVLIDEIIIFKDSTRSTGTKSS